MDYTKRPVSFKLRKAFRYARLYGPRRTVTKVRGQYHLKSQLSSVAPSVPAEGGHVGIIGCGNFAFTTVAYFLRHGFGDVIRGVMDIDPHRAASLAQAYGARYHTTDSERLLADPSIDLIFIASNHASHADYAVEALRRGKHVHIEKPHAVDEGQLNKLADAMAESQARVSLGFNRPGSRIGRAMLEALRRQPGAGMYNWFVAGHEIPSDHWYYQEAEGGRVLGNLCHWIDFTYQLVDPQGRYPIQIVPARATQSDCDIAVSYIFADGSIGAITFSAKGHTFEGVRERFSGHRADLLIEMEDFHTLTLEVGPSKRRVRHVFRDHGHEAAVRRSFAMSDRGSSNGRFSGVSPAYVWETGMLSLKTREALETDRPLTVDGWRSRCASQ